MSKYVKPPYILKQTFLGPQKCPSCKRPAKKVTTKVYSNEPYNGNMVLVRSIDQWKREGAKKNYERNPEYDFYKRYEHIVWDGETYIQNYGFFCSQPCAVHYANNQFTLEHLGVEYKDMPGGGS